MIMFDRSVFANFFGLGVDCHEQFVLFYLYDVYREYIEYSFLWGGENWRAGRSTCFDSRLNYVFWLMREFFANTCVRF